MDYKSSGVDIEAGYESVELMKKFVKGTMRPEVLGGLGGFSGAFDLSAIKNMDEPVLLSGTDGCGTKVKLAFLMDKHDTIGIDAVAINGGANAGILAVKMLAMTDSTLAGKLHDFIVEQKEQVESKDSRLQRDGYKAFLS